MLFSLIVFCLGIDDAQMQAKAQKLAHSVIILDGHVDLPYRLIEEMEDVSVRTPKGDFDAVRAQEGGLNAPFMSIYVPAELEGNGAKAKAEELIQLVEGLCQKNPEKFAIAHSVDEVQAQFKQGLISFPMGMENGAPIEGDLKNVAYFHQRGIRYITLTHSKSNHICDSSYDENHQWKGLSPFGKQVVAEMNRVGIMVDVSHISDDSFFQVMELSAVPVIASHSSCRHFTPGFERNMSDEMIQLLAKKGGVIQINFGSSFIKADYQKAADGIWKEAGRIREEQGEDAAKAFMEKKMKETPLPRASVKDVADHIEHVIKLVGVDHVGLGSDFDGVGDSLPDGLRDVSQYPNLFLELMKRGYNETEIEKIASGNVLRVWRAVEAYAQKQAE
ncbi:MAG: dipeptidase [Acidobacteria bacterium]|nr:dipeptidase [Acidobacteriota bacterium]